MQSDVRAASLSDNSKSYFKIAIKRRFNLDCAGVISLHGLVLCYLDANRLRIYSEELFLDMNAPTPTC